MKKLLSIALVAILASGVAFAVSGDKEKGCCSKKTAKAECSKESKEGEGKSCCAKKNGVASANAEKTAEKKACCAKKTQEASAE